MKKPVALVDMDGTLADYAGAMFRDLEKLRSPGDGQLAGEELDHLEKDSFWKARMDLIKRQPGWWLNLEPWKPGFEILQMLRRIGYRIHILTRGPKNNHVAWGEKVAWVRNHVPDAHGITVTLDKSLVYGRVLVDDWPPYIEGWLKHRPRGLVIMPDQPWNQDYTHPQVIRYTDATSATVFEALADQKEPQK